jgi:hypothetical protein
MKALEHRNRRTAVLTLAGVGFFHLVGFGVVALLMSAGGNAADRQVPQRPALPIPALASQAPSVDLPAPLPSVDAMERVEPVWAAHHKDASGPWSIDDQGRITWR